MTKNIYSLLMFTMLAGFSASLIWAAEKEAAKIEWSVDYAAAKKSAEKQNKDILMNFTGSDWCPYCIKLEESVFKTDEFKKEIPKNFILLKLDFPNDTSKQTEKEIQQNRELHKQFQVSGFPTIMVVDAKGRPIAAQVGYDGTPAKDYVSQLGDYKKSRVKRDDLFAQAEKVQGVDKAKLLDQAVSLFDTDISITYYRDEIDQIMKLDAENSAGLKTKYKNLLQLSEVQKKIEEIQKKHTEPKDALKAFDQLIDELKPTGRIAAELYFNRSYCKYVLEDFPGARIDLETALKADPHSPHADEIKKILESLQKEEAQKSQAGKS